MRLSTVLELLLILLLVAFAAYGRVIDPNDLLRTNGTRRAAGASATVAADAKQIIRLPTAPLKQAADSVNRYCTCNENICNCCRDFHIPLVQLKGPGCASLQYLQGDNLAVQLSFGDNILTSTIVNGKNPKPVCVPLPGGFSKFCGRIYSIQRDAKNHFKACLGLELQSSTELEASLRVSCFRFGPDGLKLRPAEPLPVIETPAASSDEDEDDDLFGLGSDDEDEEEDEEEASPLSNAVANDAAAAETEDDDDDDDDEDVLGFGALLDIITGDDESSTKKPKPSTAPPLLQFTIPILTRPTTSSPVQSPLPGSTLIANETVATNEINELHLSNGTFGVPEKLQEQLHVQTVETQTAESDTTGDAVESFGEGNEEENTEASNKVHQTMKPSKVNHKVKRVTPNNKKPSITSSSINAINDEVKKKQKKPQKKPLPDNDEDEDEDDLLEDDDDDLDDDDEDEDDLLADDDKDEDEHLTDDDDDEEEEEEDDEGKPESEKHEDPDEDEDEKAEDIADLDDDDDEEEDEMLSALVGEKKTKGKNDKVGTKLENDHDYDFTDLLARKKHAKSARQSRIMRL